MLDQEKDNKDLDHDHVHDQEDVIDHDHLIINVIVHLTIDHDHVHVIQDEIIIGIIIIIIIHQIKHQNIQIHILITMMKGITTRDGKVLGPGPKDLVLGPGPQIFRSKFRTRSRLGPKKS
jgi:hypothetical protein